MQYIKYDIIVLLKISHNNIKNMKLILIIACERSGTNFFCDFLGKAFLNVNSNYELFPKENKKIYLSSQSLKHLAKSYNIEINETDKIMDCLYNENLSKIDLIKKICSIPSFDFCSFKIFPNQVSNEELEQIISMASFCVFLHRNPIDRYISFMRAIKTCEWINKTTNTQIVFDSDNYVWHKNMADNFIKTSKTLCEKKNIWSEDIYYENFFELSYKEMQDYMWYKFFLKRFWNINMNIAKHLEIKPFFKKQDLETDISKKILNYLDHKEFIEEENQKYDLLINS